MTSNVNNNFVSSSVYEGENKNKIAHGKGIMKYKNGDVYDGNWKNGQRHGAGVFTYANGDVYDGVWKNNEKHGNGILIYANGEIYGGIWKNGKKHGKGIKVFQKTIIITTNADADENEEENAYQEENKNIHQEELPISVKKSIDLKINNDIKHTLQEISSANAKKIRKNRWTRLFFCRF